MMPNRIKLGVLALLNGVIKKSRFETSAAEISVMPASANGK